MATDHKATAQARADKKTRERAEGFDQRFTCGDWTIFDAGDGCNFYLQPAKNSREDAAQRTFWDTFAHAVEFGLFPRLVQAKDKRDAEAIIKAFKEAKSEIATALVGYAEMNGLALKSG